MNGSRYRNLVALLTVSSGRIRRRSFFFGNVGPAHRYYFQLLALDTTLDLLPGATRDEVLSAAKGHVIGYGNLMGNYQQAQPPRK